MFDIEENLQKGDISLRTGQNIESTSFRRLSNFYKLPGLETNKVYLFSTEDPYSPTNSITERNDIVFGYIYFYDQNRIFLRKYAPLKYIQDYFPILFRCPEDAVYIRFTISTDVLENIINTPYGLEKEKQIKSDILPLSRFERNNRELLPKHLYLSMFYAQQEDLENETLWDITLSSNSFVKKEYILYDKFVGDNLALSCKSKSETNPIDYTIIDNFKVTNFNTLVLRRMGEVKYYLWFLTRKVEVDYSVSNGNFIGEPIKVLNPSKESLQELPLSRTGTFSSAGGNLILDDLFPNTRYILENNTYLRLQKIDGEELKRIELKVEEGILYATTYPVPSTVTVKDQTGTTKTYPITQLDSDLFNKIDLPDVQSFELDTLDLSSSNITNIGENCCRDIGLKKIIFMNGSSSFKDITINSKAFSKNHISTISFPDHLKGIIDKEAFSENPLNYIFFNSIDSSNVFTTYENVFKSSSRTTKGIILCPNLEQYSRLKYGQSYDPEEYTVITRDYHYIIKNSSMEKTYQDTNGLYLYTVSDEEHNEVVVLSNPSYTSYGNVSFVRYLLYYNEQDIENTKIYYLSGIQENGFSKSSIQSVTLGFSSGEEFFVGSSAFEGCLSLTKVLLNPNVFFEGDSHFKNCESLESFPMQALIGKIPAKMFQNCENLNINGLSFLQEGVTEIGESAFENHRLEYLSIPSTVSKIGSRAFATEDYSFSMVLFEAMTRPDPSHIPGTFYRYQEEAFFQKDSFENENGSLTMITVSSEMMQYISELISIWSLPYVVKVGSRLNVQKTDDGYINSSAPYEIFIEDPLNSSSVLFDGFQKSTSGFTKFTLSDLISVIDPTTGAILEIKRVSGITKTSFNTYNTGITEIIFNLFMETLEEEVFKGNKTIKSITFGEQFKKIGNDALNNSSIETINLNSKNVTIGVRGLYQCGYFTGDPYFWSCISTVDVLGCASSGVVSLEGLRATAKLNSFSFYHCIALQTLPDPINFSIGSQAFDSCEQLKSCVWRDIPENYDKFLDSNCLVFDLGTFVTFFGLPMGNLEEVQKTFGSEVTIHNSGYIFNKCFQIQDYRIVNIPTEFFVAGIFCTESIDNSNAWIRLEMDYDTFRNNDYVIPESNIKMIYELLMNDIDYTYHSSCFFPEYYYIANSTEDPTDNNHLIDIDTLSPSSENLCYFLKMRARVEILYYGSLNGIDVPIIAVQNKTSPTFYGRSIPDGVFYQFPWYIPHAVRITKGVFAGYRVSFVGSPKDVPGHENSSSYISYLLGPAYDRSTRSTKDWIMPSSIFVSSNFRNIDLLAFCYKDEHRPDLIKNETECENMLGDIIEGKVYNYAWGDEWANDKTYNYAVHLPAKGLLYFGKSNCWENGPGGGWIHYVGGGSFNNTLIYPFSLKGRTPSMPGSLSSRGPSIARLFAHGGYCFKAIVFPRGMTDFYDYTISMRDTDTYPVKTFYFHEDQVRIYDGSFHDTKDNSDTTIYCLYQSVADSVKNGADKGNWRAYVGTEEYQFDIRILVNSNEERPEYITHHQVYRDHLLLPYDEFMNRKDVENLSSELPLSTILETRPVSVLAYGQSMDFSIQLKILKGTQEAIVTGFLPEYSKVNMRAYPFARYVRIDNSGNKILGCDIPITVWEENCCQTDVLKVLHLPFTTTTLKSNAFFTPNLEHILLNAGLENIQSRSIITKARTINNKKYTISIEGQNIVGEEEYGFKMFYIPRTIHNVASDSIMELLGTKPNDPIQENPNALRKVVANASHYLELETTQEKRMTKFYIGSEYYSLSDIQQRYSGSFIDSLPEDIILDNNFCEYKIKVSEEGDPYAVMVAWRPEEYLACLDSITEEDRESFIQEEMDRLFPEGRIVIPQYLIDTNNEDKVSYYPVGAISTGCFQNMKGIKSIRFPGSVFYYGSDLIKNSMDLQSVEICCLHPEHLTVKDGAFLQNGFATLTVYTPKHTHEQLHGETIDINNKFKKETCNIYRLNILDSSDPRGLPIKPYSEE